MSADGRYVAFATGADNLVGGSSWSQVYRKDMSTGQVVLCSSSTGGAQGDAISSEPSISADGRYVAFQSMADNFGAPTAVHQVYRKDLTSGQLYCCSTSAGGARGGGASYSPAINTDGRYVAFESEADNLVSPVSISQVFRKDVTSGAIVFCSTNASGAQADSFAYGARISANGRFAAFSSAADNLVNPSASHQIYRKDLSNGHIALCSASASGEQGDNKSYPGAISADGRFVAFDSNSDNLVSTVAHGQVYRKDMNTGRILFSSATGAGVQADSSCFGASMSADGRFVVFPTDADNLVHASTVIQVYRKELSLPAPQITSVTPGRGTTGTEVTVRGSSFRSLQFDSFVSFGATRATGYLSWSDTEIKVKAPEGRYGTVDVAVTTGGGTSNSREFTYQNSTWYLAEGTTAWGFSTYITIENPNTSAVHAKVTYMHRSGPVSGGTVTLPAESQATVNPADVLGEKDFSTKVVCTEGQRDSGRPHHELDRRGSAVPEAHNSIGVTSPAEDLVPARGVLRLGVRVLAPHPEPERERGHLHRDLHDRGGGPADVHEEGARQLPKTLQHGRRHREQGRLHQGRVRLPVIPERAMYRNNRREGHDSIGTTSPGRRLLPGRGHHRLGVHHLRAGAEPERRRGEVNLTYMTPGASAPPGEPDNHARQLAEDRKGERLPCRRMTSPPAWRVEAR